MGTRDDEDWRGGCGDGGVEGEDPSVLLNGHRELAIGLNCVVYGARNRSWLARKAAKACILCLK